MTERKQTSILQAVPPTPEMPEQAHKPGNDCSILNWQSSKHSQSTVLLLYALASKS